ncbi:hypothetical protein BDN71DRAFT_650545 [Pleurotus eryngii]|uniref:Uncharacterized protein n=1 Tax=Pleurotus eryngii TaxID=5323 RepID=A0A9P5ZFN1_PLEER|nr:hypothetical protein BDN71DRAFT_650545 [Pleurotus eryngii]
MDKAALAMSSTLQTGWDWGKNRRVEAIPAPAHSIIIDARLDTGNPQQARRLLGAGHPQPLPACPRLSRRARRAPHRMASWPLPRFTLHEHGVTRRYELAKAQTSGTGTQVNEKGLRKEMAGTGRRENEKRREMKGTRKGNREGKRNGREIGLRTLL